MRWRRVARKGGKGAGLVACAGIVVVYVGSMWWVAQLGLVTRGKGIGVGIRPGQVIFHLESDARDTTWGFTMIRMPPRVHVPFVWTAELEHYGTGDALHISLWIPLLIAAVPTGLLCRADYRAARREMAGHCAGCGYDRRGLAPDAKCPECGKV